MYICMYKYSAVSNLCLARVDKHISCHPKCENQILSTKSYKKLYVEPVRTGFHCDRRLHVYTVFPRRSAKMSKHSAVCWIFWSTTEPSWLMGTSTMQMVWQPLILYLGIDRCRFNCAELTIKNRTLLTNSPISARKLLGMGNIPCRTDPLAPTLIFDSYCSGSMGTWDHTELLNQKDPCNRMRQVMLRTEHWTVAGETDNPTASCAHSRCTTTPALWE